MKYKNHHQIYTHSVKHGVIIGQYWEYRRFSGRVRAITDIGYVILDALPKLSACLRVPIRRLVNEGTLKRPVILKPYTQVDGSVRIQVFATHVDKYWVCGELRRDYSNYLEEK